MEKMSKVKLYYKKIIKHIFNCNNVVSSVQPLILSLKFFGMYHFDIKKEPWAFLKSMTILIAYTVSCIRFILEVPYKKIYEGFAIEVLSPMFEVTCGFICVMSYFISILKNSKFFKTWHENIEKVDKLFNELENNLNYIKTLKRVYLYVVVCIFSALLLLVMGNSGSLYGIRIQLLIGFIYPFLNQNLYLTSYISSLHLLQERSTTLNIQLTKNKHNQENAIFLNKHNDVILYINITKIYLTIQEILCDLLLLLVKINGPIDVCTRLLNWVILVCSIFTMPFAFLNHNYTSQLAFNLIFGLAVNQIFLILFLRSIQKCVLEVSNLNIILIVLVIILYPILPS